MQFDDNEDIDEDIDEEHCLIGYKIREEKVFKFLIKFAGIHKLIKILTIQFQ